MMKENSCQPHCSPALVSFSRSKLFLNISIFSPSGRYHHNSQQHAYVLLFLSPLCVGNLLTPQNGKKRNCFMNMPLRPPLISPSCMVSPNDFQFFRYLTVLCNYTLNLHFISLSQDNGLWQPVLVSSHMSHPSFFWEGIFLSLLRLCWNLLLGGQSMHSISLAMAMASTLGLFPNPGH